MSQALRASKPPMEPSDSVVSMTSSRPPLLRARAFSRATRDGWMEPVSTRDRAKAFSASMVVRPPAARRMASRISGGGVPIPAEVGAGRGPSPRCRPGQGEVETGDLALQLGGQGFPNTEEKEHLPGGLGVVQGVAQLADEGPGRGPRAGRRSRAGARGSRPRSPPPTSRAASGFGAGAHGASWVVSTKRW